ncbi:Asp-tRNA(Asn)/Glu-tRNA(Gln) amidotransferase subunit GatC [Candidatus Babeliales bacterium]|nr:Asp-tRNA(Asn)/Glu-tRNA(Gln) amidotransferase subunit GatC [Candidatus Babeliales bacterium]
MTNLSKEEILRLAQLSAITLNDAEIDLLRVQLAKTIDYTQQLEKFETTTEHDAVKNINVFREDKAVLKDSSTILAQAPQTSQTYFVVPKILDRD